MKWSFRFDRAVLGPLAQRASESLIMDCAMRPSDSLNYAYEPESQPLTHLRGSNAHERRKTGRPNSASAAASMIGE